MNRRNLIKTLSVGFGATLINTDAFSKIDNNTFEYKSTANLQHKTLLKPVTAITLGAGGRGTVYGDFAFNYPDQLKIIGVAEPIAYRNKKYTDRHKIEESKRFQTWEDVFKTPKMADAIIITTPDDLHYAPCMAALALGYDILLEKPIAPTEKECRAILAMAKKTGRIVAVCHVLRYAPYFIKMKELLQANAIGKLISIQHFEPIEHKHMAHSFVRGNWHNSKLTTPIILSKSCHDLDIIKWIVDKPSKSISAMGNLTWFKRENAPTGSTARCTDNCAVEATCPYSALKIYQQKRRHTYVFELPDDKKKWDKAILEQLKTTNYGRCVYRMDNDQPDHYIANIEFEDQITASFSMEAFTSYAGRRTRIMGSMGDMVGDMTELVVNDFRTDKRIKLLPHADDVEGYKDSGHGGGDWLLAKDFVQAVAQQNPSLLTSTIDESIESHIMAFMAEKSRLSRSVVDINMG